MRHRDAAKRKRGEASEASRAEDGTCAESSPEDRGSCGCRSRRPEPGAERARARAESRALAVNRVLGRRGKVVGDRYHARPLTTPRQMRTSMVYVLLNFRKHLRAPACIDPRSSGHNFLGWQATPVATDIGPATALPRTWMACVGWRRAGGPLRVDEQPATAAPRPT